MKIYEHIFFDLDRTLWDFDRNSALTLKEVLQQLNLQEDIPDAEAFIDLYHRINVLMWDDYRKGTISKERLRSHRFYLSLKEIGINDRKLADRIGADYLRISPTKTVLVPHARDILEYLSGQYHLHILTNGFHSTQTAKIGHCGIEGYFDTLITSESVGHHKPSKGIFEYALGVTGATRRASLMVGDDLEVDVIGARDSGIDQVYFNPECIDII